MSNAYKTSAELPFVDLTDNVSHVIEQFELNPSIISRRINRRTDLVDLVEVDSRKFHSTTPLIESTKGDNLRCNPNIPFIDLTGDDDQLVNYTIPVIDLTSDDAMDIDDQIECIDLTNDEASISNQCFYRAGNDLNHSTYFTDNHNQNINSISSIDLIYDNDEFAENRALVVDRKRDNARNITHQLHQISLLDKQQNSTNGGSPINLACDNNQSIGQTIPLISSQDKENYRRPVLDLTCDDIVNNRKKLNLTDHFIQAVDPIRNDTIVEKTTDDREIHDIQVKSCKDFPNNIQENVAQNNRKLLVGNPSYDGIGYNIFKCKESSDMSLINNDTSNRIEQNKSNSEALLKVPRSRGNFNKEDLSSRKHEKTFQNNTTGFPDPAGYPIPFRRSLGRSTVNTSENVPIECTDVSKGISHSVTAYSVFHRKSSKSSNDLSKRSLSNSSALRTDTFSIGDTKQLFLKFWILLIIFLIFYTWYFTKF